MTDWSVCLCCSSSSSSTNQPCSKCIEVACLGDAGYLPASWGGWVKRMSESSPCRLSKLALVAPEPVSWTPNTVGPVLAAVWPCSRLQGPAVRMEGAQHVGHHLTAGVS